MPYPGERYYPASLTPDVPIEYATVPDLLASAASRYGSRTFIDFRGKNITFTKLDVMVRLVASAFLTEGFGAGSSVALYLGNTPDYPVFLLGALKAGARVVNLTPLDGELALVHKLQDSGARVLVTNNETQLLTSATMLLDRRLIDRLIVCDDACWGKTSSELASIPVRPAVSTFHDFIAGVPEPARWPQLSADDIALLQYTGGTTGAPKGAMLSHKNLTAAANIFDLWRRTTRPEQAQALSRMICVLPLFHIYALTYVLLAMMLRGGTIILHQRFDVYAVLRDIEVKKVTDFPAVPTMWIAISAVPDLERRNLSSLAIYGSGGAPLPDEVTTAVQRRTGLKLITGWGMTETSATGTGHPHGGPHKPGSIGLMLPGVELDVVALDDPTQLLGVGEIGELRVRGPTVTTGYWNSPSETAAAFVGDRFLTGDIGYMDPDGYFYLVDRKKDLIISGGFNVYPQAIEEAIYKHPDVFEVTVIGVPDRYRGEAAKAFIKLRDGAAHFSLEQLRVFLDKKLGRHELPAALEFVDQLPRTPVGKLSRAELRRTRPR